VRTDGDFEELFQAEFDRCVRVARRIVGDEDLARDLAAEAFARAWARWRVLRTQHPGAWVVKVTANLAIDATRRRTVPPVVPLPAPSPEDAAVLRSALVEALVRLPTQQRLAIALRYLADYSEHDTALVMGVSAGTVKRHTNRGISRLRRRLDPHTLVEVNLADG
jgi:RNA polymerase sigma-70 factor (ECF subfamily)